MGEAYFHRHILVKRKMEKGRRKIKKARTDDG
jgi:hypothetical protein